MTELRAVLGEAIHTAFRKASDHPDAVRVWRILNRMPEEEWSAILDWIADSLPHD